MAGTHDLALFVVAVFILNATPGVDMVLTIARTLSTGARGGIAVALGISAGCAVHAVAAAFGLAAVLATSAAAFNLVKWAGAAYLLWLALALLRSAWRGDGAAAAALPGPTSFAALFRQGLLTNLLNPKVALFFLALLPQFIAADAPDKTLAFLFLGALMIAQGAVFLFGVVLLAARLRRFGQSRRARRTAQGAAGALFALLAARLALSERA
jgi:threonine/homoserine/homoserine lactone efflux protein